MGVSVRAAGGRYTEWQDWKTGVTLASELYTDADEPAETRNLIDDINAAAIKEEARKLLQKQFPVVARSGLSSDHFKPELFKTANLLYEEDFSSGELDTEHWQARQGTTWKVIDGRLVGTLCCRGDQLLNGLHWYGAINRIIRI